MLVGAGMLGRLAFLIHHYSINLYISDQWDFLDPLFTPRSFWEQFSWQHGSHRMGLGLPLMVAAERATRWNQTTIAWLNGAAVAFAAVVAVLLKRRVAGSLTWNDVVIPILFLNS